MSSKKTSAKQEKVLETIELLCTITGIVLELRGKCIPSCNGKTGFYEITRTIIIELTDDSYAEVTKRLADAAKEYNVNPPPIEKITEVYISSEVSVSADPGESFTAELPVDLEIVET